MCWESNFWVARSYTFMHIFLYFWININLPNALDYPLPGPFMADLLPY